MKTKLKETVGKTRRKYVSKFFYDEETRSYEYEDIHMHSVTKDVLVFVFRDPDGKLRQYYLDRHVLNDPDLRSDDEEAAAVEFLSIIEGMYHLSDSSDRIGGIVEHMQKFIKSYAFLDIVTEDLSAAFGFSKKDKSSITRIFDAIRKEKRTRIPKFLGSNSTPNIVDIHDREFVDVMFVDVKVDASVKYTSLLENPKIGYKSLQEIRKEKDTQHKKVMDAIKEASATSENGPVK